MKKIHITESQLKFIRKTLSEAQLSLSKDTHNIQDLDKELKGFAAKTGEEASAVVDASEVPGGIPNNNSNDDYTIVASKEDIEQYGGDPQKTAEQLMKQSGGAIGAVQFEPENLEENTYFTKKQLQEMRINNLKSNCVSFTKKQLKRK